MEALARRVAEAGLSPDPGRDARIWAYFQLLEKWNARVNLTGFRVSADNSEAIDRLLIEPLLAAAHAGSARTVADVGSGSGSPAIPFAIAASAQPALTMVESRERKSVFLREALRETGLTGDVLTARFEEFAASQSGEGHEIVTVRAVRLDRELLSAISTVLKPGGRLFWFHEEGQDHALQLNTIEWVSKTPLVPALKSWLSVARKNKPSGDVSRETSLDH
jgi:16S rRNA (guanine527-N7)-methyltransferase